MSELYKRENGIYYVDFYVKSKNGKLIRQRKSTGTSDPIKAKAEARKLLVSLTNEAVEPDRPKDITLSKAFDLLTASVVSKAANTIVSYDLTRRKALGLDVKRVKTPPFHFDPDMPLSDLNTAKIRLYVSERQREGVSNNSINVELRVLKRVVRLAASDGYLTCPTLRFEMLPDKVRSRKFSKQEEAQIIRLLEQDGSRSALVGRDLFVFLIDTGVRLNEAVGSLWSDFDLSERVFEVRRPKTNNKSLLILTDRVVSLLNSKHNQTKPFVSMDRPVRVLRLVINKVCNTPDHSQLIKTDGRAVIHSCRDTFASRIVGGGLSLFEGSKLLGHTTQHMTAKYSHLENRKVALRAAAILNG